MRKRVLVLAPHPDDECLMGMLPLRLMRECGFGVEVIPFSLGSRVERRQARVAELREACRVLGFGVTAVVKPEQERMRVQDLEELLVRRRPVVVFLPHAKDGHATHRAAHAAGVAAMDAAGGVFQVVETEYWHPLERPNLMVAADESDVGQLCRALECHKGEMARNDYAARLPAWMIDNVRRGAELVGGAGAAAPDWLYAVLYRARIRAGGKWRAPFKGGHLIESSKDLGVLAQRWK